MTPLNSIASNSAIILLLASTSAADTGAQRRIALHCDGTDPAQMCGAMADALSESFTGYTIETVEAPQTGNAQVAMTLHYAELKRTDSWLSAQISWRSADGQEGNSPAIEYSVMDRQLAAEDLNVFARQLVRLSNIPTQF